MNRTKRLARISRLEARTPLACTRGLAAVGTGRVAQAREPRPRSAAAKRGGASSGRAESFPPGVAALIDARDPWCVHCGSPDDLQRHHRRLKGSGGDPRPHTQCTCNGVRLCPRCHLVWAHREGRLEAEAEGIIIPRATKEPGTVSVLVHTLDGGMAKYPHCDGTYQDYPPEEVAA